MDTRVDIIVLGATGFTGKHVVKNLALLCKEPEYSKLTWGISGRSKDKIQNLLSEIEEYGVEVTKIPVIECDIKNESSIATVTKRARVLLNATGPNTVLSEPVVKACIQTGTHYLDISAELHHMLNIYRTYNKAAEQANVLIIPACGFDCMPSAAGLIYLEDNFKGTLNTVEGYMEMGIPKRAYFPGWWDHCLLNYGTWQSLVHELQNLREYHELKKQTYPELGPEPEDIKRSFFHRKYGKFWFPYPGPDHDVIETSQVHLRDKKGRKPYHYNIYTTMPLLFHFFVVIPVIFFYYYACYFKFFRNLLWNFPRIFTLGYVSQKGPTERMMNEMTYSFTLVGKGWDDMKDIKMAPNKKLVVKVSGNNPGYRTTALSFISSAVTVLNDYSKMPKGGVVYTEAAFHGTKIVDRLNSYKDGMKFEILEEQSKC